MRDEILREISEERDRQDKKWGGPPHDDLHSGRDWARFREKFDERVRRSVNAENARGNLIKLAALAIAQIEVFDRMVERRLDVKRPVYVRCAVGHRVYATRDREGLDYIPAECPACVGAEEKRKSDDEANRREVEHASERRASPHRVGSTQ